VAAPQKSYEKKKNSREGETKNNKKFSVETKERGYKKPKEKQEKKI